MTFLDHLRARAAASPRRIVFPETGDARTMAAIQHLAAERIVEPVLIANPDAPGGLRGAGVGDLEVLDPLTDVLTDVAASGLVERRGARGLTMDAARQLMRTPLYFADALVAAGRVDGCVAGASHTTADVLRAALWVVGPADGVRTVSSAFYMVVHPFRGAGAEVLTFTDCAVVPYPTSEQLADIALAAAGDRSRIVGDEPIVGLLSFSTAGSGGGASVDRVRQAVELIHQRAPDLAVDGELQGDAALILEVGTRKAPRSPVAGRANVLVFPSLDAGNIAYKLVQRLAGASAVGPILQGLRRPCSDLSRGADVEDIINVAAIVALQASGGRRAPRSGVVQETMT
jgi:phosphate acetyltransferase